MQVFIIFFSTVAEAGIGTAIIQNKSLDDNDYNVLFNYSCIFSVIMALVFGMFGGILAKVYNNPIYNILTWVQGFSIIFNGFNIVPSAILSKMKKFKTINLNMVFSNFIAGIAGVSMALLNFGVYSLIFNSIVYSITFFILNKYHINLYFSKNFNLSSLKKVWYFSKHSFGFNFINYFSRNADNMLIGKFMGSVELGNYSKAYQLLMLPNSLFGNVINRVLQPVLSDFQDDVDYIRNIYYKIVHFLALIGLPLSIFLSMNAKSIIYIVFGTQWTDAIIPFSILSLTVWIQLSLSGCGAIFLSRNQPRRFFYTGLISSIILVTSIIIGIYMGSIITVSYMLSIGFIINFFVSFYQLIKFTLKGDMINFYKNFITPFILGIITFLVLLLIKNINIQDILLSFMINGIIFLLTVSLFIYFTKEKDLIHLFLIKR